MKEILKENMYKEIKEVRDKSSFSIKEFGKLIGISDTTISRVERKKCDPSDKVMNKLKALAVIGRCSYLEHGFDVFNSTFVDSMAAGVTALKTFNECKIPEIAKGFLGISLAKEVRNICEINNTALV